MLYYMPWYVICYIMLSDYIMYYAILYYTIIYYTILYYTSLGINDFRGTV